MEKLEAFIASVIADPVQLERLLALLGQEGFRVDDLLAETEENP